MGRPWSPSCRMFHLRYYLKVKVKLSMFLIYYHVMKTYGGVELELHLFLVLPRDGGKRLASRPCPGC